MSRNVVGAVGTDSDLMAVTNSDRIVSNDSDVVVLIDSDGATATDSTLLVAIDSARVDCGQIGCGTEAQGGSRLGWGAAA